MNKSNMYRQNGLSDADRDSLLKACAPNFYEKVKEEEFSSSLIVDYVKERYDWCYKILKKFSELKFTIFNLGNHESEFHFLVLQEIGFLMDVKQDLFSDLDFEELKKIFYDFEGKLYDLEKSGSFKYIKKEPFVFGDSLILGIPGMSHSTVGDDQLSQIQEAWTVKLVEKTKEVVEGCKNLIIYNHTQANYNREDGSFSCASPSLSKFIEEYKCKFDKVIFVQSHNHWSHAQFMKIDDVYYVLNNAGLHSGIFNILEVDDVVKLVDVDIVRNLAEDMSLNENFSKTDGDLDLISRYYSDAEAIARRRMNPE